MLIHSRPSMADTNQPIVYSRSGKTKELVAGARKTISFDVCPQVAWWCKVTHQPGGVRPNPSNPPWIHPCIVRNINLKYVECPPKRGLSNSSRSDIMCQCHFKQTNAWQLLAIIYKPFLTTAYCFHHSSISFPPSDPTWC